MHVHGLQPQQARPGGESCQRATGQAGGVEAVLLLMKAAAGEQAGASDAVCAETERPSTDPGTHIALNLFIMIPVSVSVSVSPFR